MNLVAIGQWARARMARAAARRRARIERRVNQAVNHPIRQRSFLLRMIVWGHVVAILTIALAGNLAAKTNVPWVPFISQQCPPVGAQSFDTQPISWLENAAAKTQPVDWPPKWSRTPWKIPGWIWRQKDKKLGDYSPLPTTVYGAAMMVFTIESYVIKALLPSLPGGSPGGVSMDGVRTAARMTGTPSTAPTGQVSGDGPALARSAAAAAGFTGEDLEIAVAVAGAESRYQPAVRSKPNTNGTYDHGLWQINSVHAELLRSGDWRDPATNARMARTVWQRAGGSWKPWTTYKTGAYRKYLPTAGQQPAIRTAAFTPAEGCDPATVVPASAAVGGFPASGSAAERGLSRNAVQVLRGVTATFGPHTYYGIGSRSNPSSDHPDGNAVDVMIPGYATPGGRAHGDQIAAWVQQNAAQLGVTYIIWSKAIWYPGNPITDWRTMGDRGSDTANHYDHVHISVA